MSHGITNTDKMFSVRETPWHKLGVILPDVATAKEAIEAANLSWTVSKRELQTVDGIPIKDKFATVRNDTNKPLGVVGKNYSVVQNVEAFRFFDNVAQDANGAKYHTAGSLHGGKRVWILAKLPTFIEVSKQDIVEEYLLLSTGHDGMNSLNMMFTPVRVVCQNTLLMAENTAKNVFRHFHSGNIHNRVIEAQDFLGIVREAHKTFSAQVEVLTHHVPTNDEINEVLSKLYPLPEKEDLTAKVIDASIMRTINKRKEVIDIFRLEPACNTKGAEGTAWGLYNAITDLSDHGRENQSDDTRVLSNWYGSSANFKIKTLEVLLDLAK